ncbi:MAG: SDR family oxidoreductase [archaeon]|nr:SDR family oxidoreductase [archaeon]
MKEAILDKVAIVTGSARGIGKGIVELFLEQGAKVVVNDIDAEVCEATTNELLAKYPERVLACVADVTKKDQVDKMVSDCVEKFGTVDILVNNAGLTRDALVAKMSDKAFDLIVDINLYGTLLCTQAVLPIFQKEEKTKEFKKIVNFASSTGVSGNVGQFNYGIAKGGNIGMTKSIARELSSDRVCVNIIAPASVETRMTAVKKAGGELGIPQSIRDMAVQSVPFGYGKRMGMPLDLARVVLFFSCELSDWCTGQMLLVDGAQFL